MGRVHEKPIYGENCLKGGLGLADLRWGKRGRGRGEEGGGERRLVKKRG